MLPGRSRLASLAGLCLALTAPAAVPADRTIVHAGWLLADADRPPLMRQSIVIEGDRIARVTPGYLPARSAGAADARVVDLSDSFVLPGLIDSHVHLAFAPEPEGPAAPLTRSGAELAITAAKHAAAALGAGFTTVVDLGAAGIPGHEGAIYAVRDQVQRGRIAGPRILAAGTPISATGLSRSPAYRQELLGITDPRATCDGPDDCRRAVRHQVGRGADIIVFFNTGSLLAESPVPRAMSDAEMRAIVETSHALGRKVIADGHHAAGIAAAQRAGADILDSLHLYDESTFVGMRDDVFVQSHIFGMLQAVGDSTGTLHEGLWGWLPEPVLMRFFRIRQRPFAVIAAYRAGVRNIAYASDAGVYRWGDNAADFQEFVTRGIPAADAIRFATANAARMLGLDDELGSITDGKRADIVATGANPLDDVSALRRIHFVMRDGVVYRDEATRRH